MDNKLLSYLEKVDNFPALPGIAMKVMKMAMDPDVSLKNIANEMSTDVALATRILKVANSSFYAPSNEIKSINQAAVTLGSQLIRNIALQLSLIDVFPQKKHSIRYEKLFEKSLCAALAAEVIAKKAHFTSTEDMFLAGLFEDIGMFVMMHFWPDKYIRVIEEAEKRAIEIRTVEQEMLGATHDQVGIIVAERWGLPEKIITSIKYHHDLKKAYQDNLPDSVLNLVKSVYFAGIVSDIYYGWNKSRNIALFEAEIFKELKINKENAVQILSSASELITEMGSSMNIEVEANNSYTQMLQDANIELGKLNIKYDQMYKELKSVVSQLKKKNHQLDQMSKELDKKNKMLQDLANKDGLTGIYNHRYFQDFLLNQFKLSARYRRPLSLILIDIDNFKNFNDTYGHQSGDNILKGMSKILTSVIREVELAARYGGEEFVVVLPETILKNGALVAERLRKVIEQAPFQTESGETINITCSFGVSTFYLKMTSTRELIEAADKMLYKAKKEGRNRVCYPVK